MDLDAPLPKVLRLRGMVSRAVPPDDATLTNTDELGLTDGYNRLRNSVRSFVVELSLDASEFDQEFPPLQPAQAPHRIGVPEIQMGASRAKNAATLLRSLTGYVEGLIEAVVLDQEISMQQIEAAREAARQPPGFRLEPTRPTSKTSPGVASTQEGARGTLAASVGVPGTTRRAETSRPQ